MNHGTNTTYSFGGCRCEPCTRAHAKHMNLWRMGRTDRLVDATGTHRRIEALMTLGWSRAFLSGRLGHQRDYFAKIVGQRMVTGRVAAKVAGLYDELCMTPAPDTCASRRVRAIAARKGYVSPLAWDDDTIDDPTERPQGVRTPKRRDLLAEWHDLRDAGESIEQAAVRLGVTVGAIERAEFRRKAAA